MKIMGIDQSLNGTAVCIVEDGILIDFSITRSDKSQDVFQRALYIALSISDLYGRYKPDVVHIEGLAFGMRGNATRDLAGLLFTIVNVLTLYHPSAKMLIIPPTTLKKFATGSGKSKKINMIAALPEDIRKKFTDANYKKTTGLADLADSYHLANYKT
jgi:Holliday junction resolvasome RuvABC endonuclease subunit